MGSLERGYQTDTLSDLFSDLFPASVMVRAATLPMHDTELWDSERPGTERMVQKRLREFVAGRTVARWAITDLGGPAVAIPRAEDRTPIWPEGVVGSITHCDGLCAAAVARVEEVMALGLDAEPASPLPPDLYSTICTTMELERFEALPPPPAADWAKIVFSAKESFYKAWFPLTRSPLDFTEVEVHLEPATSRFTVEVDARRASVAPWPATASGMFRVNGDFVATGVVVPPVGP